MAIVHGVPEPKEGLWESYLYEDPNLVMKETTKDNGMLALSFYQTAYTNKDLSLLNIHLKTGRKNQIRVQSANQNHPIIGDKKYGLKGDPFVRLGLHAYLLEFTHPSSKKRLCFKSHIPKELADIIRVKVYINEETLSLQVG
jgi:23S rRNA pseudouridine1911/1915/1917 synthase